MKRLEMRHIVESYSARFEIVVTSGIVHKVYP